MTEIAPFNIMAKPVCGVCNLDCCYCYYTMKPRELYGDNAKFQMSDEVLESYIRQYLEAMPVRAECGWQGGEPTLAGLDFFKRAVELQKQYAAEGQVVTNALQTNGTLLDEAWCEFLAENNFLVGLSLDGPPQWHDTFRRDHANNRTFHRAWAGLELLRKHKVEFNILVTLNSANAPHAGDIYRYFVNRGIHYVQFIPILERDAEGQPTSFSCKPDQFGKFMLDVYDIWSARDVGKVSERLIDCVLHTIIYGHASTCCYARKCGNAHVLEFNGDLYACDHFVYKEWKIGNIMERPLAELVQDPRLAEFDRMKLELPSKCAECRFLPFCFGGCPKHHVPIGTDPERVNYFCEGLQAFFEKAIPELYDMAQYIREGQLPPPKEPAAQAAPDAPANRNAPCPCGSGRKYKSCCGK
ncbi:MAG: Anaerobic sulfatase-maturating enzyme [Planctomycetes bacterium ADurb.Bin126]|nr:MAG: Anaerobic sulfatase-maturating enzyme [Planctomycetes bacterium ADurb.Bin126]HOD83162.1 anaerobic sulfatase maturase [Phycisphaerae bacterium]HQL74061.1 anaerobic sulfatase maturase [Phycisphaerae bacterium]